MVTSSITGKRVVANREDNNDRRITPNNLETNSRVPHQKKLMPSQNLKSVNLAG